MSSSASTLLPNSTRPLPADDLRRVVDGVGDAWNALHRKTVWITGANGFVGSWMSNSLAEYVRASREFVDFWINVGDVENWWPYGRPDYVVHATADGVGWQHVANVCRAAGAKMLLLSSGAVYGKVRDAYGKDKPAQEYWFCMPTTAYGAGKQLQERSCKDVAVIARLFSFIGPGLRRHTGREFLEANPINVKDDGAVRSYLYGSDLAAWLWTILLRGQVGRAYNVGSGEPTKVVDFAKKCGAVREVEVNVTTGVDGSYYVPNVERAEQELGLRQTIGLDDAIRRTLAWQQNG
jgi:UDP-glucuronate decarboxylase